MVGLGNDRLQSWMNQVRLASSLQTSMSRTVGVTPSPTPIPGPSEGIGSNLPNTGGSSASEPGTIWRDPTDGQWYNESGPIDPPENLSGYTQVGGQPFAPTQPSPTSGPKLVPGMVRPPPSITYDTSPVYSGLDDSSSLDPQFGLDLVPRNYPSIGGQLPPYNQDLIAPGATLQPGFNTAPAPRVDYVPFDEFGPSEVPDLPTSPQDTTGMAPSSIFAGYEPSTINNLFNNQYGEMGPNGWDYSPFANISIGRDTSPSSGGYVPFYDYPTENAEPAPTNSPLAPNSSFNDFTTDETPDAIPSVGGEIGVPTSNDITNFGSDAGNVNWGTPAVNYYYDPVTGDTHTYDENWTWTGIIPNGAIDDSSNNSESGGDTEYGTWDPETYENATSRPQPNDSGSWMDSAIGNGGNPMSNSGLLLGAAGLGGSTAGLDNYGGFGPGGHDASLANAGNMSFADMAALGISGGPLVSSGNPWSSMAGFSSFSINPAANRFLQR